MEKRLEKFQIKQYQTDDEIFLTIGSPHPSTPFFDTRQMGDLHPAEMQRVVCRRCFHPRAPSQGVRLKSGTFNHQIRKNITVISLAKPPIFWGCNEHQWSVVTPTYSNNHRTISQLKLIVLLWKAHGPGLLWRPAEIDSHYGKTMEKWKNPWNRGKNHGKVMDFFTSRPTTSGNSWRFPGGFSLLQIEWNMNWK